MAFDNNVFITGNLTRDPELRFTASNIPVCSFGIAWNQRNRDGEDKPHYFNCTAWRDLGENIAESFRSGDRVSVVGRLDFQQWERDGQKQSRVEILVEDMGPSARWATTTQTKVSRGSGPSQPAQPNPANSGSDFGAGYDIPDEEPF
ncbi:MAG: single-stranded DNA-binding protein [Acidimicrobiaceae bacterium]|nr:single-stranded DNA-binding protein [Acidimicrobiaceae bacterium]|tara:strand:- start:779 stop:1219 length:441 start_codon:yes stop_codon:yes gene_type:complete